MKALIITSFVLAGTLTFAQSSINRNINDDGKTLSIRVNGTVNGQAIDYDRTFDVADLSKEERTALRERILDSLNVNVAMPHAPRTPHAPRAPRAPRIQHSESITLNSDGPIVVASSSEGNVETTAVGGKQPYTKEVKYNSDSGKLYLRYRFEKDGDNVTYERTLDAKDKSQEERQRMIDDIEKSIGVPKRSK